MTNNPPARQRFRKVIRRPEPQLNLAEGALCISWEDQGTAEPADALAQIERIAATARARVARRHNPHAQIATLNEIFFGELGFKGNTWRYNDPANSFIDRVIATRHGLPITLSVIYLEVCWRLGLPMVGVALPGHFLTRYAAPYAEIFVDPFHGGRLWSHADCEQQIASFYGHATPALIQEVLTPPTKRSILTRILRNLKNTYMESEQLEAALAAIERILLLDSVASEELRDRGLLRARLGQVSAALEDLERYARLAPQAADLSQIQQQAQALTRHFAPNN